MSQLIEKILFEIRNKNQCEFFTNETYQVCEQVKYKLWDEFSIDFHEECNKTLVCVKRKNNI